MLKKLLVVAFVLFAGVSSVQAKGREELKKAVQMQVKQEMTQMDVNKDGVVSEEEFLDYRVKLYREQQKEVFKQLDKNGDGVFSEAEYEDVMMQQMNNILKVFGGMKDKMSDK